MSLEIGIDPDLVKSGVGVVRDGRLIELHCLDLFDLLALIDENLNAAHFIIEDVESMKPTFPRQIKSGNRAAQMANISQKVGQVKAIARVICLYLDKKGATYDKVKPLVGIAKKTKNDAEMFKKITGWEGRSNQDNRDAAMLALFGTRQRRLGDYI